MKLIGILRGAEFSPNMTDSDAAILQAVSLGKNLRQVIHGSSFIKAEKTTRDYVEKMNALDPDMPVMFMK